MRAERVGGGSRPSLSGAALACVVALAGSPPASAQVAAGSVGSAAGCGQLAGGSAERAPGCAPSLERAAPAPHDALAVQLDDEATAADRAIAVVVDKLAAAQTTRTRRLRAAYRLIHAAPGADAMGEARLRAAARLLLDRDIDERALLADDIAQLRAARLRIAREASRLPSITLPDQLARPAPGKIARRFGTLEHERSKATLSRRGIDIEVADQSPVTAPAAGTVRYTGPIRGLDQGVIIDHGSYVTVLAKLAEIALPVGAPLAAGDRIGRAARHRVYFEVRVKVGPGGLPVDPEPLLARPRALLAGSR